MFIVKKFSISLPPGSTPKIGLGNGHRKSKEFEDFVLTKRIVLRNDLKLCEKAAQKLLSYSNNFLHKRMKTDPDVCIFYALPIFGPFPMEVNMVGRQCKKIHVLHLLLFSIIASRESKNEISPVKGSKENPLLCDLLKIFLSFF